MRSALHGREPLYSVLEAADGYRVVSGGSMTYQDAHLLRQDLVKRRAASGEIEVRIDPFASRRMEPSQ